MKAFPKVIYVTQDIPDANTQTLLAWDSLDSAEIGKVAVYRLENEVEKREVTEVRRKGTKQWFKL